MLKYFKNIFVLITLGFIFWMLFLDSNSFLIHKDLNEEISDLENEKEYYRKEIIKDNKAIKELKKEEGLEKFAREAYYMKRENEDIYIIEYADSLKSKNNE